MLAAEFVDAPEDGRDAFERGAFLARGVHGDQVVARVEQTEAFLRERIKDVVLAWEVPVDGGGAVFDFLGDLADGDVAVALADEQLPGRIEDGPVDSFAISLLTFFDAHTLIIY